MPSLAKHCSSTGQTSVGHARGLFARPHLAAQLRCNPIFSNVRCRSVDESNSFSHEAQITRRTALSVSSAALLLSLWSALERADGSALMQAKDSIVVVTDVPGTGKHPAQRGDLLLLHYVGTLEDGTVFDSTRGGLAYRDGGAGVLRPVALRLGGSPTPGLTEGLQQALEGMTVGGTRTVTVPPGLGFGTGGSLAPYAFVPPGATLSYSVELLRLSTVGPDNLMSVGGGTGGGKRMAGRGY